MYNQQKPTQEKEIQITNLSSRDWEYQGKKNTTYLIKGNDGVDYETADKEFYQKVKLGETLKAKFWIKTRPDKNGKVWTNYILVTRENSGGALRSEIIARMEQMEKNILAAIKLHSGNLEVPDADSIESSSGQDFSTDVKFDDEEELRGEDEPEY